LRTLQEQQQGNGFTVMAFPCNQFGAQEPGSDEEILEFAQSKFDVNFPMFAKIEVNGDGACELYQMLTSAHADDEGKADIAWNFTKFLIGRDGEVLTRFAPKTSPEDIAAALSEYL
jgi:glutathione peroxidase